MPTSPASNFAFLKHHAEQLARWGMLAEKYLADDPNTCLIKLRQFGELLGQTVAARMGSYQAEGESAPFSSFAIALPRPYRLKESVEGVFIGGNV